MHKKFEINRKKIKGGCQSGRKVVNYNYKSDLPPDLILKLLKWLKKCAKIARFDRLSLKLFREIWRISMPKLKLPPII